LEYDAVWLGKYYKQYTKQHTRSFLSMLGLIFCPEDGSTTFFTRQFMYNVTLRRVRATNVAVEKQWVLHILSLCL